jgi:uncharacterized protein
MMNEAERLSKILASVAVPLKSGGISGLYLFGSRARGDHNSRSDIDLFCDIDPKQKMSLFDLMKIEAELTDAFGTKVDLMTRSSLHPLISAEVQREAVRLLLRIRMPDLARQLSLQNCPLEPHPFPRHSPSQKRHINIRETPQWLQGSAIRLP